MNLIKKLAFAPLFLITFTLLVYQFAPLLISYDFVFSLSMTTLTNLIAVSALIFASCLLFVLFASIAQDLKLTLPVACLSALIPILFLKPSLGLILSVAIFVSLLLIYLSLDNTLKSYLNFQPSALLGPSIRHLSGLLILSFCLVYFLSISNVVSQNGFQIPDSLIDTALKIAAPSTSDTQSEQISLPQLTPDQLDLLKKNPDLLKQSAPQSLTNDLIKQTAKDQIENFIKPYSGFIPAALAVILFLILQSITSIINLLIYPLLWIIFFVLEKTGFIRFEIEQRPVKKLVV